MRRLSRDFRGEPWGRFGRSGCLRRDSEETREALRRLGGSQGGRAAGAPRGRLQVPSPSRAGCCLPTPVTVATARAPPAPHRRRRCRRSCWAAACRHRPWSYWPRPSAPPAPSTRTARRDSSPGEGSLRARARVGAALPPLSRHCSEGTSASPQAPPRR